MKLVLYLLFWRNVDGYVNINNIDMFDFIIVRNTWNKCYICKAEFTDSMKYFDYLYQYQEFKCKMCDVRCNGVKVLLEHCEQEDVKRQSEKYHTFFMLGNGLRKYMLRYHKLSVVLRNNVCMLYDISIFYAIVQK